MTKLRCLVLGLVFAAACLMTIQPGWGVSGNRYLPFYNLQAQSYLRGKLDLDLPPGWWDQDMVEFSGKHYLAIGALNGVLFVPFVKLWGPEFPERIFTLLVFALYLLIIHRFVARHAHARTLAEYAAWVVALALGTEILSCTVISTAWFSAELSSSLLVAVGALTLLEKRGSLRHEVLALALICLAALGRFHLFLMAPLFFVVSLAPHWRLPGERWRAFVWLALPGIGYLGLIGAWNWARFGNPLALNYHLHHYAGYFRAQVEKYGFTSWRYVFPHIYHGLFGMPKLKTEFPFFDFDDAGNGLFALSPFLLFLIFRPSRYRAPDVFALICTLVVCIPIFMHFSVGWRQFGYRYSLDFLPFLAYLLARARFSIVSPLALTGIGISLWFHAFGLLAYIR